MSYRVTSLDHLMAHELLNLEGDFKGVNEPSITRVIPVGYSYASFLSALKRGAFYLLTDNPSIPLLLLNQDEQSKDEQKWLINPQANSELKVSTFSRFNHNVTSSSFITNSGSTNSASKAHRVGEVFYPALPLSERSPEPLVSDEKPRRFDFEYNLAIAGDITTQHDHAGGSFHLERTRQEGVLGEWTKKVSNGITYLTLFASVDEPKRLRHDIQSDISTPFSISNVTVAVRGSNLVNESYLLATPAVQVGERLGLPTQGYFYLFLGATLIQEYKILGESKFSFYATKTTPSNLSDEKAYRFHGTTLLLHWKMHGELVTDQHILYLEEKITIEKLKSITSTWLDEHAYSVDVNAILGAISLDVLDKTTPELPATEPQAVSHPKNVLYEYPTTFLDDSNKVRALTWQKIVDNDTPVVRVKKLTVGILISTELQNDNLEALAKNGKGSYENGDKGDEVTCIQNALIAIDFELGPLKADSDFGPTTKRVVTLFQTLYKDKKLRKQNTNTIALAEANGIVDQNTLLALDEAVKGKWSCICYELRVKRKELYRRASPVTNKAQQGGTVGGYQLIDLVSDEVLCEGDTLEADDYAPLVAGSDSYVTAGTYRLIDPGKRSGKGHNFRLVRTEKGVAKTQFGTRSTIDIHIGNYPWSLEGCICLGLKGKSDVESKKGANIEYPYIGASKTPFNEFKDTIEDKFIRQKGLQTFDGAYQYKEDFFFQLNVIIDESEMNDIYEYGTEKQKDTYVLQA